MLRNTEERMNSLDFKVNEKIVLKVIAREYLQRRPFLISVVVVVIVIIVFILAVSNSWNHISKDNTNYNAIETIEDENSDTE